MAVSMAGFASNDAIVKSLAGQMNMGQVMAVRGLFATVLIGLLAWRAGALAAPKRLLHPMVLLRTAGEIGATTFFLLALARLPIANVSAVLQALPLAVTMGAALVLGEPVGWRRWLAIGLGFLGVLIVVRPGFEGFDAYALLALVSVLFAATRDIATRRVPAEIPSLMLSSASAIAVTLAGAALVTPFGGWQPVAPASAAMLLGAAVLLLFGYQFIIMAVREGDIAFVAPFRYAALLWSILLGMLVFGEIPDGPMLTGAAIIVGSGLYALYRERRVGRLQPVTRSTDAGMAPDGL